MSAHPFPIGTVTFLLTDIEGSTRAWQSERAGLAESIQHHYELLDRAIEAHGGVRPEEQGEGDSVVAVFTDPVEAIAAAVEAQRALSESIPDLAVRMALHTGEAKLRNERNYVGLAVIRCARIRSAGHGRQILASEATVGAVGDRLPAGCATRWLGHYGLKGLTGRTGIVQIDVPGLSSAFPPLTAGTTAAGNLPHRVSSFVGRRAELAAVTDLTGEHRLVTVTGDAGVGKSRLALAAAVAVADACPGGAWWVSLGDVTGATVDDLAAVVAHACSLERRGTPWDDVVAFFATHATALVVLDGADGSLPGVVALVDRLLSSAGDLRVVVTCCEALGIGGEVPYRLLPYPPPTATDIASLEGTRAGELFLARMRDAGGSIDDGDVDAVVQICRRWGTAADIEMAAIRAATTPPAELLHELDELGSSASGALSSSSHWHLRSLGDVERLVLARLSVFQRSIDPDAALSVVVGSGIDLEAASEALGVLTDRRVVGVDGGRLVVGDRFRDAIRSWPADVAWSDVRARYVDWFTALAERFDAGGATMPVSWIADDLPDAMAAVATAREDELPAAYRLIRVLGARWHELDRWDDLVATSTWLATRSPSDGELDWGAAVARTSFAAAGLPDAAVHRLREEAVALAGLNSDVASSLFLEFGPTVRSGDPSRGLDLFDRAVAADVEAVALAIASVLMSMPEGLPAAEMERVRADAGARVDLATFRDPVAAASAR